VSVREERWQDFDRANPHIFAMLRDMALGAKRRGRRVGIRLLWEKLRWDLTVESDRPEDAPKLNDWFPPYYSRRLMREVPELAGFFEVRARGERFSDWSAA
jgi:hypothetical protein